MFGFQGVYGNCPISVFELTEEKSRFPLSDSNMRIHTHFGRLRGSLWVWKTQWYDGEIAGVSIGQADTVLQVVGYVVKREKLHRELLSSRP